MMIEGSVVTILALAWLFLRLAEEGELRQQLLERGLDPRAVRRAVRYGRGEAARRAVNAAAAARRPPRRSRRLLARAEPRLLPRAPRTARLHAGGHDRRRARRDRLVPGRLRRRGGRPARGARRRRGWSSRYRVGLHHLALSAPSRETVDERAGWLRSIGAALESEPREYDYMPGYYAVFFYDPDGIKLEIVHVPDTEEGS